MSYHDRGWAPYVPVAERRRRAVPRVGKLAKKGHPVAPVVIDGARHRHHVLGQGVERQPGKLPRFRKPPAARDAPMCATARCSTCRSRRAR